MTVRLTPLFKREDAFPIVLHVDNGPSIQRCGVQGLVEAPERRVPIVRVFALHVGMMDDQAEAGATRHRCPLQHFDIAVGIAESGDRGAAAILTSTYRRPGLAVDT